MNNYFLEVKWDVPDMPPAVGPFGSIGEANDFAKLNVPNGTWTVRELAAPYAKPRGRE